MRSPRTFKLQSQVHKKIIYYFTFKPRNFPVEAIKWRILLLLKLINTSVAVILPWFRASSLSNNADGARTFLEDWRRKRPFLQFKKKKRDHDTMK